VDARAGLEPLRKELHKRYKRSHKVLRKLLDDPKSQKLYDDLEQFAQSKKVIADSADLDSLEVAPSLVRHFAGSFIWRRYESVLAYDTAISPETSEETLHRLRIAFKRLRYTIEFFEDAFPPTIKNLHDQLVQAQDDLGAIHDDYAANLYLTQTVLDTKKPDEALLKYRDSRETDSRKMREDFLQRWKVLSGPKFKKQLATEIANMVTH
jgi:CHAD domain-containing protein